MTMSFYKEHNPAGTVTYDEVSADLHQRIQAALSHRYRQREAIIRLAEEHGIGLEEAKSDLYYLRFGITKVEAPPISISELAEIALCDNVSLLDKQEGLSARAFTSRDQVRYEPIGNQYLETYDKPGDILNQPVVLFFPEPDTKRFWHTRKLVEVKEEQVNKVVQYCKDHIPKSNWDIDNLPEIEKVGVLLGRIIPFEAHTRVISNLDNIAEFLDLIQGILKGNYCQAKQA